MIKELYLNNKTLKYKIINKNNKHTYFRYKDDYLEISKSKNVSNDLVVNFLNENFNKFHNKYIDHLNSIPNNYEVILEEKSYILNIKTSKTFKYQINNETNQIDVYSNFKNIDDIKLKIYHTHLVYMINKIEKDIKIVLKKNRIKPLPIKISYYKSKFGSYHKKKKEITLNLILAKANIKYLYYVIMHEYAHTKEFNHSKNFYKVLKKLMPDYEYYDKSLKDLSIWL